MVGHVVGGPEGSRLWGYSVGIAMAVVVVTSPVLGAIADFTGSKKRFLLFYTALTCLFTALMFFVQKGDVALGMAVFVVAKMGYRSGQFFYNALLPEVAEHREMGRVSGNGWAIGLIGGIVCLLVVLVLVTVVGPAIYGVIAAEAALWFEAQDDSARFLWFRAHELGAPLSEQLGQRVAVLPIIAFLVAGLALLMFVDERRVSAGSKE